MSTSIQHTWLGHAQPMGIPETFPDGTLNAKQLASLLSIDDNQYGRVVSTHPSSQVISQITDDIVEVHVSIGKGSTHSGIQSTLWIDSRGNIVATAVFVNQLGTTTGRTRRIAESYWTMPDQLGKFGRDIITTTHEYGMWSLGDNGAIPQTRKFIREHYTEES